MGEAAFCYGLLHSDNEWSLREQVPERMMKSEGSSYFAKPYAIDPDIFRDEKETEKLYKLRIDETYRPYTVFDVLSEVFRRSYSDDLLSYIGEHPGEFKNFEDGWKLARAWVNELYVLCSEAGFFQNRNNFQIDIEVEAKVKLEESRKDGGIFSRRERLKGTYRFLL